MQFDHELGAWEHSAHHLLENRVLVVWPFDDELPPAYLALLTSS